MVKGETKRKNQNTKPKGGKKTKIEMKKIQNKDSLRVTFSKRRKGLFSKTSQFCLLSGAQIAILSTPPPCSDSNVSFYSFGHSSVDGVVSAFLSGNRLVTVPEGNRGMRKDDIGICLTNKDLGLGFWWEDDNLSESENPEELKDAIDSMSTLLSSVKQLKKKDDLGEIKDPDSTLSFLQSSDDDLSVKFMTQEQNHQILTDNNNDMDFDDWAASIFKSCESVDDYDVTKETTNPPSLCTESEVVEDGANLDDNDLIFSEFLNEFITSA